MSKVDVAVTIAPKEEITDQLKKDLIREQKSIDIIELRIDQRESFEIADLERLFKTLKDLQLDVQVLVTYRTSVQGGKGQKNGNTYYEFLQDIIQIQGYDMVDIEWDEAQTEILLQLQL